MAVSREPYYEKGQLVWHQRHQEVLHIVDRYQNVDCEEIQYAVTDPTHTAYQRFNERDLRSTTVDLPVTVLMHFKPGSILDLDALIDRVQELPTFSEIKREGNGQTSQAQGENSGE